MTDHCQENKSGLYDPSELRCSFGSGFHTDSERSVWIKTDVGEWTCDPWCVERGGISTAALKQSSFSAEAFVRLLPSWDTKHLWPIELRWHKNKCIFPRLSTQSEGVVYSLSANISLRTLYFSLAALQQWPPAGLLIERPVQTHESSQSKRQFCYERSPVGVLTPRCESDVETSTEHNRCFLLSNHSRACSVPRCTTVNSPGYIKYSPVNVHRSVPWSVITIM